MYLCSLLELLFYSINSSPDSSATIIYFSYYSFIRHINAWNFPFIITKSLFIQMHLRFSIVLWLELY